MIKKAPLLSVVIPVYNCGKYLDKVIKSIEIQDVDYELILVNDGSLDNSLEVCKKYAITNSRIKVYSKENGGVSSARNFGIEKARGKYINFIDADDYLEDNCYNTCLKILEDNNLDLIKYTFRKKLKYVSKVNNYVTDTNIIYETNSIDKKILDNIFETLDFCNVTTAIFKRELIKDIRFNENYTLGEDYLFLITVLFRTNNFYLLNKPFYNYIVNSSSITHNFDLERSSKKLENSFSVNDEILELMYQKYNYKSDSIKIKNREVFNSSVNEVILHTNYKVYKRYIDKLMTNKKLNINLEYISYKKYLYIKFKEVAKYTIKRYI